MNHFHRKLQRNIISDYFYTFINNLNMASCIWVLYLGYHGMNLMQIGILEGIYHLTGILFEIPSGAIADLLGRKRSLLVGRILMAVSCIIMLFSTTFTGFAISFVLQSLSGNFNSGAEEALVYDSLKLLAKENTYPAISGRINMLIEVSQSIATVAGGILAEYSFGFCYFICVIIAILSLIPVLCMTEPPLQDSHDLDVAPKTTIYDTVCRHFRESRDVLKDNPRIFSVIVFYSTVFAAFTLLFFYSQQYFIDLGLNKIELSIIMLFAGIAACLGALLNTKLYQIFHEKIALIGALSIAVCIIAFGLKNLYIAFGALLVSDFFNSALYPIQSDTLNRLIPSENRATLLSVNSMFFSIFMILMFPLVGAIADVVGLAVSFIIIGIFVLVVVPMLYRISIC